MYCTVIKIKVPSYLPEQMFEQIEYFASTQFEWMNPI